MSRIEHALVHIMESIAAEEAALAELISAQTEIVKLFDRTIPHFHPIPSVDRLVAFNTSIDRILLTVLTKEKVLQNKLDAATSLLSSLQQIRETDETEEE